MSKKNGRSKDELMDKSENAIKFNDFNDDKTIAKWVLFKGLEVAPLSQTMIDFLYKKHDVTEEMLDFFENQNGSGFSYGDIDANNVQEYIYEFLERAEIQMLSEKLYERAEKEMNKYVQDLRNEISAAESAISNDSILVRAYKLTVMNEILIYLGTGEMSDTNKLQALLTFPKPLDYLYEQWGEFDANIKDNIIDAVENIAYDLSRQTDYNGIKYAIREADEDEEDMEI